MDRTSMTISHQEAAWEWRLDEHRAERLRPAARLRWLQVLEGRVWLTRTGAGPHGDDLWLGAGERVPLPAGSEWVLEGWPVARLQVLEAAPCPVALRPAQRPAPVRGWLSALRDALVGRPGAPA